MTQFPLVRLVKKQRRAREALCETDELTKEFSGRRNGRRAGEGCGRINQITDFVKLRRRRKDKFKICIGIIELLFLELNVRFFFGLRAGGDLFAEAAGVLAVESAL